MSYNTLFLLGLRCSALLCPTRTHSLTPSSMSFVSQGWCGTSLVLVWTFEWRMVNSGTFSSHHAPETKRPFSQNSFLFFLRELLYSPEDISRSSPFFWAFRKAFPDQSDQIFGITDAIPPPIKEVGPAFQTINLEESQNGQFLSQVKVATFNGVATSIMTTRGTIVGIDGVDGIKIQVDTTKPEQSTVLKTLLGPLGPLLNENLPPFPSGQALERLQPGSSQVIMRTTFCDEGLRLSRNDDKFDDIYVWRRREFINMNNL